VPSNAPTKPTAIDTKKPPPVPPPMARPIAPQMPATTSNTIRPVMEIVMRDALQIAGPGRGSLGRGFGQSLSVTKMLSRRFVRSAVGS